VTAPSGDRQAGELHALDALLFEKRGWFLIDEENRAVAGVVVVSLEHGLQLVDSPQNSEDNQRRVTLVGRLNPAVDAVDVDIDGAQGDAIVEQLVDWCANHDLWWLVRPSGGSAGRAHVLTVAGEHRNELEAFAASLRRQYRLSGPAIDLRGGGRPGKALRPLSAPHRTGVRTLPHGRLDQLLAGLRTVLAATSPPSTRRPTGRRGGSSQGPAAGRRVNRPPTGPVYAQRSMPAAWAAHLQRGTPPPCGARDRSTVELLATGALVRAGHSADSAWTVLQQAPAGVAEKAKDRGRAWWERYVWSAAAQTGIAYLESQGGPDRGIPSPTAAADQPARQLSPPGPAGAPSETQLAVAAAREALQALQWRLPARERPGVLLVAHTLLDRMDRVDATTVPCPLRDLELDTGLSLPTVSGALNRLHGLLGRRVTDTFDSTRRESTSHTFVLDGRFADLVHQTRAVLDNERVLSQPSTPASHTPLRPPPLPPGVWAQLGPRCAVLWRTLYGTGASVTSPGNRGSRGLDILRLARRAGMTSEAHAEPTARQIRTVRAHLGRLVEAGLVFVDVSGGWFAGAAVERQFVAIATADHQLVSERVARERHEYRSGVGHADARWRAGQGAALQRQRKADLARQRQWWANLDADERARRAAHYAARFAALPPHAQTAAKDQWAVRRAQHGLRTERARHEAWVASFDDATYDRRSIEQAFTFALLPRPLQVEFVHQWAEHRATWDVPRGPTVTTLAGLDRYTADLGQARRDQQFADEHAQPRLPFDESSSA